MEDERIGKILPSLRHLCAEGEALLEAHSVRYIVGDAKQNLEAESGMFLLVS